MLENMPALPVRGRITSQTGHRSHTHTWGQFMVSNQASGACSIPEDPHRPGEDADSTCNGHKPGLMRRGHRATTPAILKS